MSVRYCEQREGDVVVDSTIARGGETPVAWRSVCVAGWQLGRTTKSHCAERWGKGRAGSLPQSSILANWSPRDVTAAQSQMVVLIANREFSHLGLLDFESERDGDGTNFCVFACGIAV